MPGTTPNGVPYAEPTDPLVQWPATSRSLAEAVDAKIMTQTAQPAPVLDANWLVTQGLYFTEGQAVTSLPEPGINGWLSVWRDPGGAGVQFFIKQQSQREFQIQACPSIQAFHIYPDIQITGPMVQPFRIAAVHIGEQDWGLLKYPRRNGVQFPFNFVHN
jgi:hypothetical protein